MRPKQTYRKKEKENKSVVTRQNQAADDKQDLRLHSQKLNIHNVHSNILRSRAYNAES